MPIGGIIDIQISKNLLGASQMSFPRKRESRPLGHYWIPRTGNDTFAKFISMHNMICKGEYKL